MLSFFFAGRRVALRKSWQHHCVCDGSGALWNSFLFGVLVCRASLSACGRPCAPLCLVNNENLGRSRNLRPDPASLHGFRQLRGKGDQERYGIRTKKKKTLQRKCAKRQEFGRDVSFCWSCDSGELLGNRYLRVLSTFNRR